MDVRYSVASQTRQDALSVTITSSHIPLPLNFLYTLPRRETPHPPPPFHTSLKFPIMSDVYSSLNVSPKKKRVLVKDDNTLTPKKMRLA